MLSDSFDEVIRHLDIPDLSHAIFYNCRFGIRFEIGGDETVYINDSSDSKNEVNPTYVSAALERAKELYMNLPHPPNILRIDTFPDEEINEQKNTLKKLLDLGLIYPQEQKLVSLQRENEDEAIKQLQSYWKISKSFRPQTLLREIIKADIGGISGLASNVYFINSVDSVLFHLYDDRGADLVASDKETLRPIFEKFNDWILDYDREQIKRKFSR